MYLEKKTHIQFVNKYIHIKYWDTKEEIIYIYILFGYLQNFYC